MSTEKRKLTRTERKQIEAAIASLRGDIEQVPPMYSALKHHGKALYEYAREGVEIPREPRRVTIYRFELLERDGDSLKVRVECSKGTYVRTLASDLGALLGCGAHLTAQPGSVDHRERCPAEQPEEYRRADPARGDDLHHGRKRLGQIYLDARRACPRTAAPLW